MKRILPFCFLTICAVTTFAQTTYYWVGGKDVAPQNINVLANWNTALNGSGATRPSSTGATDILVFDGSNYGGATLTTGIDSVNVNAGITCGQMKFINNATIYFVRNSTGTGTITIAGDGSPAEDFVIESGCTAGISNGAGSIVFAMAATNTGRVSGNFAMVNGLQASMRNTTAGKPGSLVFTSGANFYSNITSASASYAFGNSGQSSEKWVVFQAGASLYYDGGSSPMGSSSGGAPPFQPVEFQPGSNFYIRASNAGAGTFANRKVFANVIVQNGATFTADGPITRIDNLTITSGSTFTTHTSGQTPVLGDLEIDGILTASAASTNELVLAGASQTVSGMGTISIPSLMVSSGASVLLNKNINVSRSATINGKVDFGTSQISGEGAFRARGESATISAAGNLMANSYLITGVTGTTGISRGMGISGEGLSANTSVVSFTANLDSIYISRPALITATNVAVTLSSKAASLTTANTNGFDTTMGSVVVTDTKTYEDGLNYTINAATTQPFGISSGFTGTSVSIDSLNFNADAITNIGAEVSGILYTSGKVTIRPSDVLHLLSSAKLYGAYGNGSYFITDVDASGNAGVFIRDNISGSSLFPVGTAANYLPVTLNPTTASDFAVNVFEGITKDGTPAGVPFTSTEKQMAVDAVWNINRITGTGDANVQLQWTPVLEGTTMAGFDNSEIGIVNYTGSAWSLPFGTGDNAANTADTLFSAFGLFSAAARPPQDPFVFNSLPVKIYGDADFSGGAISSNTTAPIIYTSSNTAVATIVGDKIHITGAGTADITASQASDGVYPAASITQSLTVHKTNLTITADNKLKPEGDPNPPLTATYSGFVYNETQAVLTTPVSLATTATTASPVGAYPITASGATAANYTITFVDGTLTVNPRQHQTISFGTLPVKTYGNADFAAGATGTNTTIPITYASSNTGVATITGSTIHITGAGTTTITASQAGSPLYHPAPSVAQVLTVNKANLTVRTFDTTRLQGESNPDFRISYSGFVNGETVSSLVAAPTVSTSAIASSAPGYYPITLSGGVSNNYNFVYTNARLTVLPSTGAEQTHLQAFMSSSSTLTVRVFATDPDLANIIIYDMGGKPVLTKNVFLAKGFLSFTLPVSRLAPGAYTVSVRGSIVQLRKNITIVR